MIFHVLTLFPDMVRTALDSSILGRAAQKGLLQINAVNIRDFSDNIHNSVDDYTYGGGAGMLMQAQPVFDCCCSVQAGILERQKKPARVLYMSPQGRTFNQEMAKELALEEELILLCGHYEGVDQRALDTCVDEEISIGDYILTGGETAAIVLVDCLSRFIPGVLGSSESPEEESFSDGLLEYPQYTRPRDLNGMTVPDVLLNGDHAKIREWRRRQSLAVTARLRPDLLESAELSDTDRKMLKEIEKEMSDSCSSGN